MAKEKTTTKKSDTATAAKEEKSPVSKAEHVGGVPAEYQSQGAWGGEDISNEDIIIPKILLMQPMSELVTDGVARIGEFRDSMNKDRKLGDEKTAVELIIFGTFKTWLEFKDDEYLSTKQWSPQNADLKLEEVVEDGSIIRRDKVLNFYCLIPGDIASGEPFPFVLSCRRTSAMAGKTINTHIKKLQMFKKPSAAKVFALTSRKETNDKGTFFVSEINVLRDSTPEELTAAYEWYKALAKSKVRVDDSDLTGDSTTDAASPAPTSDTNEARPVQ